MNKALIKIAYKQIIDASSQTSFEKNVYNASYKEFLLKSQAYNPDLNNQIPNLQDTLGQNIRFETYKFEVIESDITNKSAHKVAIIYFTDTLTLFEIIGDYMLLGVGDNLNNVSDEPVETFLLKMQLNLSIVNYQLLKKLVPTELAVTL